MAKKVAKMKKRCYNFVYRRVDGCPAAIFFMLIRCNGIVRNIFVKTLL